MRAIASYVDAETQREIHLARSQTHVGMVNVVVVANTTADIWDVVDRIRGRYGNALFLAPAQTHDNRWGTMGRIHA